MPKKVEVQENIGEKLEYIGLNLDKIPASLKKFEPLNFRIPKFYDEKQYRQYRYIPIKDIQILLTPSNRLDELEEKYSKASPLYEYLDQKKEENILKHTKFLEMLKQVKIEDIEKVEEEQAKLNKKIPFKVKFEGNYLWQIYYSENTDKYFMLVPTEEADYSTFFFLLKKQLEKRRTGKIFVPIRNVGYTSEYIRKNEFEDLENYLWLFTKDWPLIYEVYDKKDELTIQIVGETEVYEKVKSSYNKKLKSKEEATQFYKLLKAMFILQTELPDYFSFRTDIDKNGEIEFYFEDTKMEYLELPQWIFEQYELGLEKIEVANELIDENQKKIKKLQEEGAMQEIEYLAKEKQISTFLECKKTFFGKFKYYFKYSKKNKNKKIDKKEAVVEIEPQEKPKKKKAKSKSKKDNYTIEELLELYQQLAKIETDLKNLLMDINALKLKNKNRKKKIENATKFIEEIDSHKKSIFEFWKYTNKDEVATLAEGEVEEVSNIKKITKVFDFEEDFEKFGKMMDKIQRRVLTKDETDSLFLLSTNVDDVLNKVKNNEFVPKDIENSLKELKKEAKEEKMLTADEEFDIFGRMAQDRTKVSKINNKKHREIAKDKYSILEINKNTKQLGYKLALEKVVENIKNAIQKVVVVDDLPIYKAISDEKLEKNNMNLFNINEELEINDIVEKVGNKINLYKINLRKGINAISYTNIIFYDNQNKTLPVGQDLSTKILVDISKLQLERKGKKEFHIVHFDEKDNDFSKVDIKTVNVCEYDIM